MQDIYHKSFWFTVFQYHKVVYVFKAPWCYFRQEFPEVWRAVVRPVARSCSTRNIRALPVGPVARGVRAFPGVLAGPARPRDLPDRPLGVQLGLK